MRGDATVRRGRAWRLCLSPLPHPAYLDDQHLHCLPQWCLSRWSQLTSPDTFDYLVSSLENELDWPQLSATSGFTTTAQYYPEIL